MADANFPQQPTLAAPNINPANTAEASSGNQGQSGGFVPQPWPAAADLPRLNNYNYYELLFNGDHFTAFSVKIDSELYGRDYARIRYIVANFPGLISKIVADLLFIEPPKIKVMDGDQDFVDELETENKMRVLQYESALDNSYLGDILFKIRVDKRNPEDKDKTVLIEPVNPKIWFPILNPNNVKGDPIAHELAWIVESGGQKYLRKEIHYVGYYLNELYLMKENKIIAKATFDSIGEPSVPDKQLTKINRNLIIHIPNWRAGSRNTGISDYYDLDTLFYAINNRLWKTDNILDKHSDPILAIPDGILDENGKVKRAALGVVARPKDGTKDDDPAYITWEAKLEAATEQLEKLIEILFMISETSPDILGMGKGQADSGKALRLKLLRTIAKAQRKQLYYTTGLQEIYYVAQLVAKAWGLKVNDVALTKDPTKPDIVWQDGLPKVMEELLADETAALDAGLTTKADSIQRVYDVDEKTAKLKAEEIKKEQDAAMPLPRMSLNGKPVVTPPAKPGTPPVPPAK
jgi:hypothetical protein